MTSDAMIVARDLSIGWSPDAALLEHASFDVKRGEIFGILGRSACGKSTLLRALIGLEPVLAGTVEIAGVGAPQLTSRRPAFGVMFQQGALFGSMTLGENLALPLERWTDLPRPAASIPASPRNWRPRSPRCTSMHLRPTPTPGSLPWRITSIRTRQLFGHFRRFSQTN